MKVRGWARLGLWMGAGAWLLASGWAQAKAGLEHQLSEPHFNSEVLQLDVLDLQVQALGGPVRMVRSWHNGQWVWNQRWSDLEVLGAADPQAPLSAADPANAERPYAILRAGSYLGGH